MKLRSYLLAFPVLFVTSLISNVAKGQLSTSYVGIHLERQATSKIDQPILGPIEADLKWKTRKIIGMAATGIGAAGTAVGIKLAIDNNDYVTNVNDGKRVRNTSYRTGAILAPVSAIICAAGITLWAISEHKIDNQRKKFSLKATGTSLDLALNF